MLQGGAGVALRGACRRLATNFPTEGPK
jgi:hypothetical protein